MLFIIASYISLFASLYIDLITVDVILLNLNCCLLVFWGQMSGGGGAVQMSEERQMSGGWQMSEYRKYLLSISVHVWDLLWHRI